MGVYLFIYFLSLKGFVFRCGVLMNLKNKGVLLSGFGRGKDFSFLKELFLG